jgi:hypothetical protein
MVNSSTVSTTTPESISHCTYAVTGSNTCWQAIYVCQTCHSSDTPSCVCQACAEVCHADHDVDYIGMGPSYCDCRTTGTGVTCGLMELSKVLADKLGIDQASLANTTSSAQVEQHEKDNNDDEEEENTTTNYIHDVYQIPEIDVTMCNVLIQQASDLANESKETFWLDPNIQDDQLSILEQLARQIYQYHKFTYQISSSGGAEWWVQVKTIEQASRTADTTTTSLLFTPGNPTEAVDLHYDKDEQLAEFFDLGSFPTLSTVTYLTQGQHSNPTLIFPHRYDQAPDDFMTHMVVSHPKIGKHISFDGRLLHGAPSHPALRQQQYDEYNYERTTLRVTFLVNLWKNKPCGIQPLSAAIKDKLKSGILHNDACVNLTFSKRSLTNINLSSPDDLPLNIQGRICLPFLSATATWADSDESLYMMCYPPPPVEEYGATLLVQFQDGMEAYLDSPDDEHDDTNDDDEGNISNLDTMKGAREEDYV